MGCSKSTFLIDEYLLGHDDASMDLYLKLFLQEEDLLILQKAFKHIDIDDSKGIRMDEFMTYFGIEDSLFNRAVFGILNSKNRQTITFLEFVVVMWNFLTIPVESISSFAFVLSSTDSCYLKPAQIISLFEMVHSKEILNTGNMRRVIDDMRERGIDDQLCFNVVEFSNYIKTCSFMIAPIINMQVLLQENLIGKSFWGRLEEKRRASEEFKDIMKILNLKKEVNKVQDAQLKRISNRDNIEREAEARRRIRQEEMERADKLSSRSMVAKGARKVRSSFAQVVKGKSKKKKEKSFDNFNDIDEDPSSEYKLKSVKRQRTPTILIKNANLKRKEQREKKALKQEKAREDKIIAEGGQLDKKKGPGRFTIALKKKQAQRGKKVSPE
mmetsp:Transcript_18291/g.34204  ORF Transcript_18291/g.34204 Transcript_18291/m.34204 type:complete len:384 (-) Transcript_18291:65-1216(-)|eukprot:CAMPEP_0114422394 /NCGR_PEP_ID=MMETSP0103-20121206/5584_1 /TAXON_ID=37642 ORGANISM="Paraphysomonas imperforata, Strain PA2" /NCGR_SAMPLE_ID=MMETSP0103 /ASSEMBLY_ACC=CAM_ASM_000201 /LENGTH=383 /DNA_ID=CAMNT_0001590971 /DNA_START=51 /DNA_END=1202 /DNA_ORIENTATION=-